MPTDLRPSTFILVLKDKKKDYLIALTKNAGFIKKLVDKNLYPLLNNEAAAKIWIFLEDRF